METTIYRALSETETEQLIKNNCTAENWEKVLVTDSFDANRFQNSRFSGTVKIGHQHKQIQLYGGVKKDCGIYYSHIHQCVIGNNVYINHVKNYIANYIIENDVIIDNTDICAVDGETSFGNGIQVEVMDETGGRKVTIYDHLSAHLAYIMAFYKHRHTALDKIEKLIQNYTLQVRSTMGIVGHHSRIFNCREIRNVKVGPYTHIDGASILFNGSINSNEEAPVMLGHEAILKNFIVSSGAEISDGAIISDCFIGQGCVLSFQYSAQNSLFFANCQGFHGEACAIFAGPYTVTHHKSTLLIAGMFSFSNAGSGSNQSNHMYKLGPIHHGIVERGSKTTSDSYILWPAKIGAFTLVMGRHYKNSDTSEMPFSYLIEKQDESWLVPGVNLKSVGTIRDALKWPKRDRRTDSHKTDCINFNLLSPFTIQKMASGIRILQQIQQISGETTEVFSYNNTKIKRDALSRGIELYRMAIMKFIGNSIITRLNKFKPKNAEEIQKSLLPDSQIGTGNWIDLAGLIAPKDEIKSVLDGIDSNEITKLKHIEDFFFELHNNYYDYEWNWTAVFISDYLKTPLHNLSIDKLIELIQQWKESVVSIDRMLYEDAKKEYRMDAMTGFGIDGDQKTKLEDFIQVRGKFEENSFVKEVLEHIDRKTRLGERVIQQLNACK